MADEQQPGRLRAARFVFDDGVLTVTVVSGHIEAHRGESMRADALSEIEQAGDDLRAIVLDLAEVIFINSSGLGALAQIAVGVPEGVQCIAHGLNPGTRDAFHLIELDKLYTIVEGPADLARVLPRS